MRKKYGHPIKSTNKQIDKNDEKDAEKMQNET